MTDTPAPVHDALVPYLDAAVDAGFEVHLPNSPYTRVQTYAYITRAGEPGCVILQNGDFPSLGMRPVATIPVHPNHVHGSSVALELDGPEPADLIATLARVIGQDTVVTRFVAEPQRVRVTPRIPKSATRYTPTSREDS